MKIAKNSQVGSETSLIKRSKTHENTQGFWNCKPVKQTGSDLWQSLALCAYSLQMMIQKLFSYEITID